MKPILYTVILFLCGCIIYLTHIMVDRPFNSSNMRNAYYHGCNIGLHSFLTEESIARCIRIANDYKQTLDDLDKQMKP